MNVTRQVANVANVANGMWIITGLYYTVKLILIAGVGFLLI